MSEKKSFITESQKAKSQLYHKGHYYRIKSYANGKFNWRCTTSHCPGSCYTYGDTIGEEYDTWVVDSNHLETGDPIKLNKLEHRRKMKEKARFSNEQPRAIVCALNEDNEENDENLANSDGYDALRQK